MLPFKGLFSATFNDLKRLPSMETRGILGVGGAGAARVHPADQSVTKSFSNLAGLDETFEGRRRRRRLAGAARGGLRDLRPRRAFKNDCVAAVGGELVQAQLVAQVLTYGIKGTVRRSRPEGGGFSFPSGHTTAAFASATVLQRHFGWKVGAAGLRRGHLRGRVQRSRASGII